MGNHKPETVWVRNSSPSSVLNPRRPVHVQGQRSKGRWYTVLKKLEVGEIPGPITTRCRPVSWMLRRAAFRLIPPRRSILAPTAFFTVKFSIGGRRG